MPRSIVRFVCVHCGQEFFRSTKDGKRRFCSQRCYGSFNRGRMPRSVVRLVCVHCEQEFQHVDPRRRFCSQSCFGSFNRRRQLGLRPRSVDPVAVGMSSSTYKGPGRYVVHEADAAGFYVAWDSERDRRASLPLDLQAALRRCLELERLYGVQAKAAA